ncbi:MAG: EAL domain-containing protein [Desulforhopalus sp.]|nr:EAL domain-containing protein [Desulforhopalus sp.]
MARYNTLLFWTPSPQGSFLRDAFLKIGFLFSAGFAILFVIFSPVFSIANDAQPLQKVRLQLKWRHQFQFAGYYAAVEKGYFRDAGLEVELIEGRPGITPFAELLSGKVEFAIESPAIITKSQHGIPIVAIAAIFQHSPTIILTRADSGLTSPKSLVGKRIKITPETDPESITMLNRQGVALGSINVFPHDWDLRSLIEGQVDGQTAYITNEPYLMRKAGVEPAIIQPSDYGIDFYGDCIITLAHEVRTHHDRVKAFRRAVQQGWIYAMANPEEIAALILDKYSKEKSFEHLLFEAEAMAALIRPELVEIGHMSRERWKHIADVFLQLGMMDGDFDLSGFLYGDLRDRIEREELQKSRNVLFLWIGIAGVSLFLWLSLVFFNRRLAKEVEKRTESLATSENNFRAFFEMASVGVGQVEVSTGRFVRVNKKYCDILGYTAEELQRLSYTDITHPDDVGRQETNLARLKSGEIAEFTMEKRYFRKNKELVWGLLTVSPLWSENQTPTHFLVVLRDITVRKSAEEHLVFASKVFDNSIEGIVVTDAAGKILQVNSAFTIITGYSAEEAIGKNPRILKSDKHPAEFYRDMWEKITGEGKWAGEIWNRRKNGEAYPEWLTISAVRNQGGKITNFVSLFHDISENFQQKEALKYQAQHDALTGLPNRVLMADRLETALAKLSRSNYKLALLYFDLDNFKYVNDAFGHTAGDDLLIELARRLSVVIRSGDTLARLGGDEFLILLTDVDSINTVSYVAARIIESLGKPFHHRDVEFVVSASIGITFAPDDGVDAVTLVKNADIAMYRAKGLGKNTYTFFTAELDRQSHNRIAMESKLRKAIENYEFQLYYQPLVDSTDGRIVGAEALIRWHSEGSVIAPWQFIPIAEESGLIISLGEWIIIEAAKQAKRWHDAGFDIAISINISSRQFRGQDLVALLRNMYQFVGLVPGQLYFEVTESMLIGDFKHTQKTMGDLRELGMRFYLDDFGTGYSSLSYLQKLPIDGLKIDKSFINDIVENTESRAIAAAVVSLAKTLNLAIVAEGVETNDQRRVLTEISEMLIQGYLVSRPVPAAEFEALLRRGNFPWE